MPGLLSIVSLLSRECFNTPGDGTFPTLTSLMHFDILMR